MFEKSVEIRGSSNPMTIPALNVLISIAQIRRDGGGDVADYIRYIAEAHLLNMLLMLLDV